jgi:1-acyl-sn-glycerol-3-phosphate acyltransferase
MADVRHSPVTWRLFDAGFGAFRRAFLRDTRFGGRWPALDDGEPILIVANHVSWWDGFILREVQRSIRAHAPFHTVVVKHQLDRYPMLRRLGGVPVDPAAPGSVRSMMRTLSRLRQEDPETVFAYFPQGRIWPTSRRPLSVKRGVAAVTKRLAPLRVLPVSLHIEPLVDVRPTPFAWLCDPVAVPEGESMASDEIERRLTTGLDEIRARLDEWGEDVVRAWPDAPLATDASGEPRRRSPDRNAPAPMGDLTRTPTTSP